jgi:YYY domain-containing protein
LIGQFLAVYLVIQLLSVAALPLALRFFAALPDRGYAFARLLGILLTGYIFWIGYSFGLLRNEIGGAWLALLLVAAISIVAGRRRMRPAEATSAQPAPETHQSPISQSPNLPNWRYILLVELVFLLAFAAWAWVRAHDPAAEHTEQPMDLMFMNSIRASLTYPPQDAWLAGHPISYYYFGYWLFNMVGMMAGQTVGATYNLAQAAWFGLLLSGALGMAYNLLAATGRRFGAAASGGVIGALLVGLAANLQGLLEWLYANGVDVGGIASVLGVRGFPEEARVTNQWFVDFGWWWWRSSRVLADASLRGEHIEVIDEFPAFSYILGDNHPHLAAMPFAILAIAVALAIFLAAAGPRADDERATHHVLLFLRRGFAWFPLGWGGMALTAIVTGALLFLNTWDYPPYWLLVVFSVGAVLARTSVIASHGQQAFPESPEPLLISGLNIDAEPLPGNFGASWKQETVSVLGLTALFGIGLLAAGFVLYLPYFLTAQSQVGGLIPNLFHPTRFSQYFTMFATALLTLAALAMLAWAELRPHWRTVAAFVGVTLGAPAVLLAISAWMSTATDAGRAQVANVALPDGMTAHTPFILARWTSQPFTFLIVGSMTALFLTLVWAGVSRARLLSKAQWPLLFVLVLAVLGLGLTLTPEIVYLRDNFGWRMNTIFKFYYQAWLLFGLAGAYTIVQSLQKVRGWRLAPAAISALALALAAASSVYLIAGAYSKAQGFSRAPTFDAAAYLATAAPAEYGAVAWVQENTLPTDVVVEAKGRAYAAETNRISTMTGRPTLLGWDGHEAQWRGQAYGTMAAGRPEALRAIYGGATPDQVAAILEKFDVAYIYVGPQERTQYELTPVAEQALFGRMEVVYANENVRIYRVQQ